jgi:hypothetical protein
MDHADYPAGPIRQHGEPERENSLESSDAEAPLLFSFCYLVLRQVFHLLALRFRSRDSKDLEIVPS